MNNILDNLFGAKNVTTEEVVKTDAENTVVEQTSENENLEINESNTGEVLDAVENIQEDVVDNIEPNNTETNIEEVKTEINEIEVKSPYVLKKDVLNIINRYQGLDLELVQMKNELLKLLV